MTGRYRDIEPEDLIVSHQASDTDHRQQSPWDSDARNLEESNKSLQGQHEAPSVADGVWLSKEANLDPNFEPQDTWQWQRQNNTKICDPESANANIGIRTQDLPRRPQSTGPILTPYTNYIRLGGFNTSDPQTKPQDPLPALNTSPQKLYRSGDYVRYSRAERRRRKLEKELEAIRSTSLEDFEPSLQLDKDAHNTNAEDPGLTVRQPSVQNEPKHPFVLLEPQIEGNPSPGTSSESFICPVCHKQFWTRAGIR